MKKTVLSTVNFLCICMAVCYHGVGTKRIRAVGFAPKGVEAMSVYEAISLMISFAMLIVTIFKTKK